MTTLTTSLQLLGIQTTVVFRALAFRLLVEQTPEGW